MAASAFAVESANIVGYASTNAAPNLNFYAPQFFDVGYNTTSIQNIKLDDGGSGIVGMGDSMQIVGPLGSAAAVYFYWNRGYFGGEGFFWSDDTMADVNISFDAGDGFAVDNANSLSFATTVSGEVPTENVTFAATPNLNWTGNAFPAPISIQDVQLDDGGSGIVGMGDSMQIVGPLGSAAAVYFYWNRGYFGGEGFFWSDDTMADAVVTFAPGQGFAIDNANSLTFDITIPCPYNL